MHGHNFKFLWVNMNLIGGSQDKSMFSRNKIIKLALNIAVLFCISTINDTSSTSLSLILSDPFGFVAVYLTFLLTYISLMTHDVRYLCIFLWVSPLRINLLKFWLVFILVISVEF